MGAFLDGRRIPDVVVHSLCDGEFLLRHVGKSRLVFYLFVSGAIASAQTPLILSAVKYEYAKHMLFVTPYEVRAGSPEGVLLGMAFHSPANLLVDKYYVLYSRKSEFKESCARQRYEIGNLVVFIREDDAILISAGPGPGCPLLKSLEQF